MFIFVKRFVKDIWPTKSVKLKQSNLSGLLLKPKLQLYEYLAFIVAHKTLVLECFSLNLA